jgi:peptide chain release factor 1
MNLALKLDRIAARADELRAMLSEGVSGEAYVKASKELSEIEPVVARIGELREAERAREASTLLEDPEMRELAEAELDQLKDKIPALEHEIQLALLPKDEADARSAILEIRPAAGGDEAGCSPPNFSRCTRNIPKDAAGGSRFWNTATPVWAA